MMFLWLLFCPRYDPLADRELAQGVSVPDELRPSAMSLYERAELTKMTGSSSNNVLSNLKCLPVKILQQIPNSINV